LIPSNSQYHFDLGFFSSQKITDFLTMIWPSVESRTKVKLKPEVKLMVRKALAEGKFQITQLSPLQQKSLIA
jgi:hypothetical protein